MFNLKEYRYKKKKRWLTDELPWCMLYVVIGCGLTLAFSEISGVAKRMVQIVFGLAIAIGSAQLLKLFPK